MHCPVAFVTAYRHDPTTNQRSDASKKQYEMPIAKCARPFPV